MTLDHLIDLSIINESRQLGSHRTDALPAALGKNVRSHFDRNFVSVTSGGAGARE